MCLCASNVRLWLSKYKYITSALTKIVILLLLFLECFSKAIDYHYNYEYNIIDWIKHGVVWII